MKKSYSCVVTPGNAMGATDLSPIRKLEVVTFGHTSLKANAFVTDTKKKFEHFLIIPF